MPKDFCTQLHSAYSHAFKIKIAAGSVCDDIESYQQCCKPIMNLIQKVLFGCVLVITDKMDGVCIQLVI